MRWQRQSVVGCGPRHSVTAKPACRLPRYAPHVGGPVAARPRWDGDKLHAGSGSDALLAAFLAEEDSIRAAEVNRPLIGRISDPALRGELLDRYAAAEQPDAPQ